MVVPVSAIDLDRHGANREPGERRVDDLLDLGADLGGGDAVRRAFHAADATDTEGARVEFPIGHLGRLPGRRVVELVQLVLGYVALTARDDDVEFPRRI